jgi:hypothetical protein
MGQPHQLYTSAGGGDSRETDGDAAVMATFMAATSGAPHSRTPGRHRRKLLSFPFLRFHLVVDPIHPTARVFLCLPVPPRGQAGSTSPVTTIRYLGSLIVGLLKGTLQAAVVRNNASAGGPARAPKQRPKQIWACIAGYSERTKPKAS